MAPDTGGALRNAGGSSCGINGKGDIYSISTTICFLFLFFFFGAREMPVQSVYGSAFIEMYCLTGDDELNGMRAEYVLTSSRNILHWKQTTTARV